MRNRTLARRAESWMKNLDKWKESGRSEGRRGHRELTQGGIVSLHHVFFPSSSRSAADVFLHVS